LAGVCLTCLRFWIFCTDTVFEGIHCGNGTTGHQFRHSARRTVVDSWLRTTNVHIARCDDHAIRAQCTQLLENAILWQSLWKRMMLLRLQSAFTVIQTVQCSDDFFADAN